MKYNSIGEQLIAKAKEIDPNYKPDKFNDMSEALDVILNNTGGGGKSVPPTLNLIDFETGEVRTTITEEEYNNLKNGLYNQVVYNTKADPISIYSPSKLTSIGGGYVFVQFKMIANADDTFSYSSMVLISIEIGEKNTSNEYPITVTESATINPSWITPGNNIDKLDIEFNFNGNTTLTPEQVALINSYTNQYVYVKFDKGIKSDNAYIGYVFSLGDSGTIISIVSGVNISGNIIIQSLIAIQGTTATHKENTITLSSVNSGKFLKTNTEGKPEWVSIPTPTITNILPLPADASTSNYVLKAVNGTVQWVKEA